MPNKQTILSFILFALLFIILDSKLIYLTSVYRHGARFPVNDLYDGK